MIDVDFYIHKFSELSVAGDAMARPVSYVSLDCLNKYKYNVASQEETLAELTKYRDEASQVMTDGFDSFSIQTAHDTLSQLVTLFS